jgi:hypothetical protein
MWQRPPVIIAISPVEWLELQGWLAILLILTAPVWLTWLLLHWLFTGQRWESAHYRQWRAVREAAEQAGPVCPPPRPHIDWPIGAARRVPRPGEAYRAPEDSAMWGGRGLAASEPCGAF